MKLVCGRIRVQAQKYIMGDTKAYDILCVCKSVCECVCVWESVYVCESVWECLSVYVSECECKYLLNWGSFPFTSLSQITAEWIYQFSSVAQSYLTLCDPKNRSTPDLPVHHQLPQFTQTHVHWVSDAIQPSHPLSSPSPPAPNPSQHQGLFQWVSSLHQVTKVLESQL